MCRHCVPITLLLVTLFLLILVSGCRVPQNCLRRDQGWEDPCPPCPLLCLPEPPETCPLPLIEFEFRNPVTAPTTGEPILGWPIADDASVANTPLRNLSRIETQRRAAAVSPIAREIEKHRDWLKRNNAACPILLEALTQQAAHERNLHTGQALELFLNLANVYCQQPTLAESHSILRDTKRSLDKIRDADISPAVDTSDIERQTIELRELTIGLRQKQQRLTRGLELLLRIEFSQTPIWTDMQHASLPGRSFNLEQQFATAIVQRADLKALELLANDCSRFTANQFRAIVTSSSPFLGAGLPRPAAAAAWWRSKHIKDEVKRKYDAVTAEETQRRRLQMLALAEAKRNLIKRALGEVIDSLQSNWQLLEFKQQRLDSLQHSIRVAEKAKDKTPLAPGAHLKKRLAVTKLQSEIIDQQFRLALDQVKLKRIRGDYGTHQNPTRHSDTIASAASIEFFGEEYPVGGSYDASVPAKVLEAPTEGLLRSFAAPQ